MESPESRCCRDSITSTTVEDDFWNLDIDDVLDMPPCPRVHGPLCLSFTTAPRPTMATAVKKRRASLPADTRRSVSFDTVQIRVFERVLTENPSLQGGPSLGLGWNYKEKKAVPLEKFETKRASSWTSRRRSSRDLLMSPEQRERMARKHGFSKVEIEKNARRIERIVRQRDEASSKNIVDYLDPVATLQQARRLHGFSQ